MNMLCATIMNKHTRDHQFSVSMMFVFFVSPDRRGVTSAFRLAVPGEVGGLGLHHRRLLPPHLQRLVGRLMVAGVVQALPSGLQA